QNVESDSDLSVMGVQNVVSSVMPSVAVSGQVVSVTSVDPTWGSNKILTKSDARTRDSKDFQSRDDRSLSGQRTASDAQFQGSNVESVKSNSVIDSFRKDTFLPSSGIADTPFGHNHFTRDPIVSHPSVTFDPTMLNLSNPSVTLVPSYMQSTPYYVSSNPHMYVGIGDVLTSTQSVFDQSHRREYVSPSRRPTVLHDSSDDDVDTDVENRRGGKQSFVTKTPCRPKSHSKSQSTVQYDKDTLNYVEMQYLRGQFEQYAQVLQSLSNRVGDLTDTVTAAPLEQTFVKQTETDSTNRLVDQMKTLIETVSKKRKTRKSKLSTVLEQSSASETETESAPQRHLIRPMKFDGVGSFETFMAHFRNCAD